MSFHVTSYCHNGFLVTASAPLLSVTVRLSSDLDKTNMHQFPGVVQDLLVLRSTAEDPSISLCSARKDPKSRQGRFSPSSSYFHDTRAYQRTVVIPRACLVLALSTDLQNGLQSQETPFSFVMLQHLFNHGESLLPISRDTVTRRLTWRRFSSSDPMQTSTGTGCWWLSTTMEFSFLRYQDSMSSLQPQRRLSP